MHTPDSPSRIARQLTLRRAERTAHVASAVAVLLTIVALGGASASESNPVTAWLIANGGLRVWAVATPILVAIGFAIIRRFAPSDRWARGLGWYLSAPLVLDAIGNTVALALNGVPNVHWPWLQPAVVGVGGLALALASRWELTEFADVVGNLVSERMTFGKQTRLAVGFSFLLVLSMVAPFATITPVQNSQAATGEWNKTFGSRPVDSEVNKDTGNSFHILLDGSLVKLDSDGNELFNKSLVNTNIEGGQVEVGEDLGNVYIGTRKDVAGSAPGYVESWSLDGTNNWALTTSNKVAGIDVDEDTGNVYAAEFNGNRISVWDSSGNNVRNISLSDQGANVHYVESTDTVVAFVRDNTIQWFQEDGTSIGSETHGSTSNLYSIGRTDSVYYNGYVYGTGGDDLLKLSPDSATIVANGTGLAGDDSIGLDSTNGVLYAADGGSVKEYDESLTLGQTYSYTADAGLSVTDLDGDVNVWYSNQSGDSSGRFNTGVQASSALTTRVTDQHGDPVQNATVRVYGFNKSAFSYSGQDELDDEIANLTEQIQNPRPPEWTNQSYTSENVVNFDKSMNPNSDHFEENYTVALAHERSAYGVLGTVSPTNQKVYGTSDQQPRLRKEHTLSPDAGEDLVITLWNYEGYADLSNVVQDDINNDVPGQTQPGNVTIERLDASGSPINSFTAETSFFVTTAYATVPGTKAGVGKNRHEAVVLRDPNPGYYRIYPEGHPDRGVVYAVSPNGNEKELKDTVQRGLKNEKGDLTERAQALQDAIDNNKLTPFNLTTNETGHATKDSMPSNVESVVVQGYKAPDGMDADPQTVTSEDIHSHVNNEIDSYEDDIRNLDTTATLDTDSTLGSICQASITSDYDGEPLTDRIGKAYAPSEPQRVDVPANGTVTLELESVDAGQYADLENSQCYGFQVAEYYRTNNFTDSLSMLQENIDNITRQKLEELYQLTRDGMESSEQVCRETARIFGTDPAGECDGGLSDDNGDGHLGNVDTGGTSLPVTDDAISDASDETLQNGTDAAAGAIALVDSSDGLEECQRHIENESGQKAINIVWCSERDIGDANIHIRLDWSNGTTTYLTPDSEYVEIFDSMQPIDEDEIQLLEYPMGSDDPPSVSATAVVIGADGGVGVSPPGGGDDGGGDGGGADDGGGDGSDVISSPADRIRNPTFSGTIPQLDSVRLSTLRPGPDERVQVAVRPSNAAAFGALENVTVTGPGGASIPTTNITNGRSSSFATNGTGEYHVQLTFSNTDGTNFTEVVRVRAGQVGHNLPPQIRAKSGPTGTYAVVSAFENGRLDVENGGATIQAVGVLESASDAPASVDIHTLELERANDATATFSLVRAPDETQVSRSITTRWHMAALTEDAVLYRHGSGEQALPTDGENQYAAVDRNGSQTLLVTYTEGDGKVGVRSVLEPGIVTAVVHNGRLIIQGVPVVGALVVTPLAAGGIGSLALLGAALVLTRRRDL